MRFLWAGQALKRDADALAMARFSVSALIDTGTANLGLLDTVPGPHDDVR
jgi:hypothetical protein